HRCVCRRASPPVAPAGVFEFQVAAVDEMQRGFIELVVDEILRRLLSRVFSKVHSCRVTKLSRRQQRVLQTNPESQAECACDSSRGSAGFYPSTASPACNCRGRESTCNLLCRLFGTDPTA